MKPQSFFRLSLLIPFLLWGICTMVIVPISAFTIELPQIVEILLTPAIFFSIGILLWFFPYTILAIGLWLWSKNRSSTALRNAALLSPILLSFFMLIETGLVYLSTNDLAEFTQSLPETAILFGGLSMLFGYFCVGIALGIFKILQVKKLILEEPPLEH